MTQDPTFPLIPILNFIGVLLVLIPFSTSSLQKWNTGVCVFAIYVSIMCLFIAIDTIVWSNNFNVIAPVWCDIVSHFGMATLLGIPACTLVITRRLCKITKRRSLVRSKKSKRNELIFDLCVTVGFPVLYTSIYYIVQAARFVVEEELGCAPAQVESGLTIILVTIWPIILPAISILFYSPRILWFFYKQRKEVNEYLDSHQTISRDDYFRIMTLGCLDAVLLLPIGIYSLTSDLTSASVPFWPGWTYVHTDWEPIGIPELDWRTSISSRLQTRYDQVINFILAVVFFLIFGLTKQARANYWSVIRLILGWIGIRCRPKENADISAIDFETREPSGTTSSDSTHVADNDVEKGIDRQLSLHILSLDGGEERKEGDIRKSSSASESGD